MPRRAASALFLGNGRSISAPPSSARWSNDEKAKLAKAHGCAHTIIYTREDFAKRVDELTQGKKAPVVYDSVGKDTFLKSLDCLAPLGVAVLFGQSSGSVEPLNLGLLAQKGSLYVTRPTLNTYAARRENLVAMAKTLLEVVQARAVKIDVNQTYPLKDAARAHADLAARKTPASTVLLVSNRGAVRSNPSSLFSCLWI